ncbi:MAG TPA: ABC transporter ATP-binding protein, partial [Terriglobales bacterium]|nr:ABC transporter ATP-binding protein [Terriglobales bacterium]
CIQVSGEHRVLPPAATTEPAAQTGASPRIRPPYRARKITHLALRELLRPHAWSLVLAFLAVMGESAASLLEPWPLKIVLDDVLHSKQSNAHFVQWIHGLVGPDVLAVLKLACLLVLAIAVLDAICTYAEKYLTTSVGQWIMFDLRRSIYAHVQKLSISFHDQSRTGDLISRITEDIDNIQSFITSGLLTIAIDLLTLAGMVLVMFFVNWQFTLIALSVVPPLAWVVYRYTRQIKKASRAVRKKEGEVTSVVEEVLSSIRVVKAFAREDYEQRRFEDESLEQVEVALRARSLKARLTPIVSLITAVGTALVLWFGARFALGGTLLPSSLVVFVWYLGKLYKPIQELSKMTDTYSKAAVGYDRIREVLETEREVRDLRGARRAPQFKGKIEFENVRFGYDPENPVLRDVSFKIEPGQVAAFVGPTGAGKSTIIGLIPRFYDPQSGIIKIDGTDIRRFTQKSLRHQISFVLQETILFHAPVWQNIAYGRPEASREAIYRAAEMANASEFIEKLPQGYDTLLGERGMTLSGGQRQRIAIARAIIRNTPILILDEPTSGLDAASEKLVFEALDRLMQQRTAIVIAHRLSTIRRADVIFVIKDGAIAESGAHDKLLKQGGIYAELHNLQFAEKTKAS